MANLLEDVLQREARKSLNQFNWYFRVTFVSTTDPMSSKKDASNTVAPETAKFIPSWTFATLSFQVLRYGCGNGIPNNSAAPNRRENKENPQINKRE